MSTDPQIAATMGRKTFARGEQENIILHWCCLGCGWTCDVEGPGFAGDGYDHFPDSPFNPCGPLVATRV